MTTSWQSCFRPGLFTGKTALVTGGGTGIGLAIARELAFLGSNVVIASRRHDVCCEAAQSINDWLNVQKQQSPSLVVGSVVAGPALNIRRADHVTAVVQFCLERYGSLDLLINNAGGQFVSPAENINEKGFTAVVQTNLTGTFLLCREAYSQYMKQHGGSIVNITVCNRNGFPLMSHSGAARAGVENLTATLSTEWVHSNVRINCVRPGVIYTESGFAHYGALADQVVDQFLGPRGIPARRLGTPEEVSSAVVWLLSDGAAYVTGTVLAVDGASAFVLFPLLPPRSEKTHLQPVYGTLPRKAML